MQQYVSLIQKSFKVFLCDVVWETNINLAGTMIDCSTENSLKPKQLSMFVYISV